MLHPSIPYSGCSRHVYNLGNGRLIHSCVLFNPCTNCINTHQQNFAIMAEASAPAKTHRGTYNGHCHCGTVKFRVSLSPPLYAPESDPDAKRWTVIRCNCSICYRNGYILVHPVSEDVEFTHGQDKLGSYTFATKRKPHLFCTECGSSIMIDQTANVRSDGTKGYAVNVR